MLQTVAAMMKQCHNYFERSFIDGTFRITGNVLDAGAESRYIYISGSKMHDGVWELAEGYLTGRDAPGDEEFTGRVWELFPPSDFLDLCKTVETYDAKYPMSPIIRETFGGYSREWAEKMMGVTGAQAFENHVREYRKMFTEVK